MEFRTDIEVFRLGPLQPERGVHRGAALDAQTRLLDDLAVVLLHGFALRSSEGLSHLDQLVPLGLRHQAGERQQFATLLLREASQVRAIGLDCAKHAHAFV